MEIYGLIVKLCTRRSITLKHIFDCSERMKRNLWTLVDCILDKNTFEDLFLELEKCYHNNFLEPAYTGDNSWIGTHQSEQTKNISLSLNLFIDVSWRWTKGFRTEYAKWHYRTGMKINSINIHIEKLTSRRSNHNTSQHEINTLFNNKNRSNDYIKIL